MPYISEKCERLRFRTYKCVQKLRNESNTIYSEKKAFQIILERAAIAKAPTGFEKDNFSNSYQAYRHFKMNKKEDLQYYDIK